MGALGKINEIQESVAANFAPERLKASAINTCNQAITTCRGSNSVLEEIGKAGKAALNLPLDAGVGALKASAELLTFQPINATKTVAKGLIECSKDIGQMCIAPVPTALAAARQSVDALKTSTSAIASAPVKAFGVAYNGLNSILSDSLPTPPTASNDNGTPKPSSNAPTAA